VVGGVLLCITHIGCRLGLGRWVSPWVCRGGGRAFVKEVFLNDFMFRALHLSMAQGVQFRVAAGNRGISSGVARPISRQ